jgi:hypothetical protein
MSESKDILAELMERRNEIAAIAGIEAECVRVVRQDEYSGFRKPSEAIVSYLDRAKKPQTREEICSVLVEGRYGRGTNRPYWDLIRAVDYQVSKKRLVERSGLIGKQEWPKDLFVAEKTA